MRAKNSNGTTVGKFSIFNLLRGRFTLLPSFRSLPHYALLKTQTGQWSYLYEVGVHPVGDGFLLDCLILTYACERGEGGGGGGGEEIRKGVELKRVEERKEREGERGDTGYL